MSCKSTTDITEAIDLMKAAGYEDEELTPFANWLGRGDSILVFSNHDLGSLSSRPLRLAMPWTTGEELPRQAPDSTAGPGWRYLPELVVTP